MEREEGLDGVGAQSSSSEEARTQEMRPEDQSISDGMSFREFAHTKRGYAPSDPNFPMLNAVRVSMKIKHHETDLRPHEDFKSAHAALNEEGENG